MNPAGMNENPITTITAMINSAPNILQGKYSLGKHSEICIFKTEKNSFHLPIKSIQNSC